MGKRGQEAAQAEGSSQAEIDNLKTQLALMEEAMKAQVLEVKSELALSQARMQTDRKKQLDDFLATFMKMNTSTTGKAIESVASHVSQTIELQILLSEKTPPPKLKPFLLHLIQCPRNQTTTYKQTRIHNPTTQHATTTIWYAHIIMDTNQFSLYLPQSKHNLSTTNTTIPKPNFLA
jgi:hypothetical protein